jgi:hypothetical protein
VSRLEARAVLREVAAEGTKDAAKGEAGGAKSIPTRLPPKPARGLPKQYTAIPKGGYSSDADRAALDEAGVNVRNAFPGEHQHHLFPQEFKPWFESKGITINEYTVFISEGEHGATHMSSKKLNFKGWNQEWKAWIDSHRGATEQQIFEKAAELMEKYKLTHLKMGRYRKR